MTVLNYEAKVASASVDPLPEPTTLPRAIRAVDAPPPKPIEWLIRDLWPMGELGLLVGDGGAFKSTVALHLAAAIAGGYPVFDRYAVTQRPAMIISAEDPQDIVLMRLDAIITGHGWSRSRTLANTYLMCDGEPTLGSARWRMHLSAEIERTKPGFIVLDPWAELQGGDENSNTDARPAIKFLRSVAKSVNAGVAVVHHAGKAGPDKRALDRIRGASALPSAARVIWFFDYQEAGVAVECLKLSRAPRTPAFMVKRNIAHLAGNRAQWTKAQLTVEDQNTFALTRAENFVIDQLRLTSTGRRTTAEFRELVKEVGRGVSRFDLSRALTTLQARNVISFEQGKQNTRHWFLMPTASWFGPGDGQGNSTPDAATGTEQAGNPDLFETEEPTGEPTGHGLTGKPTEPTENLPGRLFETVAEPTAPFRGPVGSDLTTLGESDPVGSVGSVGSPELDPEDLLAEFDERLGSLEPDREDEL